MSLKSGRHGIGIENLDWKTGKVKVPTPAGQIVKTFTKDVALATSVTLHDVEFLLSGFEWSDNYVPIVSLITPAAMYAPLLSVNCVFLEKGTSGDVIGIDVFVNQSEAGFATDKMTVVVSIVNKTT